MKYFCLRICELIIDIFLSGFNLFDLFFSFKPIPMRGDDSSSAEFGFCQTSSSIGNAYVRFRVNFRNKFPKQVSESSVSLSATPTVKGSICISQVKWLETIINFVQRSTNCCQDQEAKIPFAPKVLFAAFRLDEYSPDYPETTDTTHQYYRFGYTLAHNFLWNQVLQT